MILEQYILIEALALLFFLIGFFKKNLLSWAISLILFGSQIMSSYAIEKYIYYYSVNGTIAFSTFYQSYPEMSYINILFFAVTLVFALGDMASGKLKDGER